MKKPYVTPAVLTMPWPRLLKDWTISYLTPRARAWVEAQRG